jgi:hypothetical protein
VHNDDEVMREDDDTLAIMQLVALYQEYQAKYKMIRHDNDDTIATTQLVVVLYQDVHNDDDTTVNVDVFFLYQDIHNKTRADNSSAGISNTSAIIHAIGIDTGTYIDDIERNIEDSHR